MTVDSRPDLGFNIVGLGYLGIALIKALVLSWKCRLGQ